MKRFGAFISLLTVWLVSLLLASPLAVFTQLGAFKIDLSGRTIVVYETCVENLDLETYRLAYSIASIVFQYLLPVVTVSVAHVRISHKLRSRMVTLQQRNAAAGDNCAAATAAGHRHRRHRDQSTGTAGAATAAVETGSGRAAAVVPLTAAQKEKRRLALQRKRKTNLLLVMIAVMFALSWLPLNVCNIVTDFDYKLLQRFNAQVSARGAITKGSVETGVRFSDCSAITVSPMRLGPPEALALGGNRPSQYGNSFTHHFPLSHFRDGGPFRWHTSERRNDSKNARQ